MLVVGIKILIVHNYFLHRISFSEAFFKVKLYGYW